MVYQIFHKYSQHLLPERCVACQSITTPDRLLCNTCLASVKLNRSCCKVCGQPLPTAGVVCGQCQKVPPQYDQVIAPLIYDGNIRDLIIGLKFNGRLTNATVLASLFLELANKRLANNRPDLLLPVPLHSRRIASRGFNQSAEIARYLSDSLGIPVDTSLLRRTRQTNQQAELSRPERLANVKGAFEAYSAIHPTPKHVAVVDDVMTSGHTINELARVILSTGVEKIDVWVMARTPYA